MVGRTTAVTAIGILVLVGAANAQSVQEQAEAKAKAIGVDLQTHSNAAKAESARAAAALQAGDKTTACAAFNASRAEAQKVLDLFPQQREQVMIATSDTALALARVEGIDKNQGVWLTLASQLDERVKLACGS